MDYNSKLAVYGLQKLTPIRGRKQCIMIFSNLPDESLQKLTPIRGRKQYLRDSSLIKELFTEVNPDKGTETLSHIQTSIHLLNKFTEVNPDKGTETTSS